MYFAQLQPLNWVAMEQLKGGQQNSKTGSIFMCEPAAAANRGRTVTVTITSPIIILQIRDLEPIFVIMISWNFTRKAKMSNSCKRLILCDVEQTLSIQYF